MSAAHDLAARRPRHRYDVAIVGARVAGAATARLLARSGLDVLLVDRARPGRDTLSTHALMRAGVAQLSRWGLLERVVAAGTPPVRQVTFRYGDEQVTVPVQPSPGVDALYAPRRTVLDAILAEAAVGAGADLHHETGLTGLQRDDGGRVTGLVVSPRSGGPVTVSARLVIGADGIRSSVADLVGAPFERRGRAASAVTYGYWRGLDVDGYEWNFRPRAASGVIPTNDGAANVFVSAPPARIGRGDAATYRALLAESSPSLAERLGPAEPASPLRTFTGRPGHVRRAHGPGWALVGDAGYFKDPLSAHGITDALRDAELLARAVIGVLLDGHDERPALAAYQAQRDELSAELFEVTDVIAGHGWTDAEIGPLLKRLSTSMAAELAVIEALGAPAGGPDSTALVDSRRSVVVGVGQDRVRG